MITANWAAPSNVRAITTTRGNGVSVGPFRSFNLGGHVGDDDNAVMRNRRLAGEYFRLPGEPVWLTQVHGDNIVCADRYDPGKDADGSYSTVPGTVCVILTADCLPLFISDSGGTRVGLFHIGWRGLAQGLVRKAARLFNGDGQAVAWLGPAIGPGAFEIGNDVKATIQSAIQASASCFKPSVNGKWFADLYALTAGELRLEGAACSYDASLCTYSAPSRFFSHRRSNPCGRMASLIWME